MDPSGPPKDVSAERLFRILLRAPRASLPVRLPIGGAKGGAFFVTALHPLDDADASDAARELHDDVRASALGAELTALSLHAADGRVFRSGDHLLGALDERDSSAIIAATLSVLRVVSPSFLRINHDAWLVHLTQGAGHPSNYARASQLAGCTDGREELVNTQGRTIGTRAIQRPDRFFGVPIGDMTDGQWLAYRAARAATTRHS